MFITKKMVFDEQEWKNEASRDLKDKKKKLLSAKFSTKIKILRKDSIRRSEIQLNSFFDTFFKFVWKGFISNIGFILNISVTCLKWGFV